jgi:uncharacterized protein (TIGR02594 family)
MPDKNTSAIIDPWAPAVLDCPWMHHASRLLGTREIVGPKHNPLILSWWKRFRVAVFDDETAWCSLFVNHVLDEAGYSVTGKMNARSWLHYGKRLDAPQYGCVTVFWRGSPASAQGHVAFYLRTEGSRLWVLGGNQGNAVSAAPYPSSRLLAFRWPVRG